MVAPKTLYTIPCPLKLVHMHHKGLVDTVHNIFVAGGVPPDGIPNEEDVGVILGISILFIALSSIGIIFSLLGMCLHFAFRKKTYAQ